MSFFYLMVRGFEPVTRGFELVIREFELVTQRFELVDLNENNKITNTDWRIDSHKI